MIGKDRIILQKINNYIDDVARYVDGFSFEDFMADKKTLSSCAFSVSQIGELAKEISEDTQEKHDYIPLSIYNFFCAFINKMSIISLG